MKNILYQLYSKCRIANFKIIMVNADSPTKEQNERREIMRHFIGKSVLFLFGMFAMFVSSFAQVSTKNTSLKLLNSIELPNVKGGFDLMAADVIGKRLFVSAQDNHSVEVIDLGGMKPLKSLANLEEPKWVAFCPKSNRLYVATGLKRKFKSLF